MAGIRSISMNFKAGFFPRLKNREPMLLGFSILSAYLVCHFMLVPLFCLFVLLRDRLPLFFSWKKNVVDGLL